MSLRGAVRKLSRDRVVTIRAEPVWDGSGPRPSSVATPQVLIIKMAIQYDTTGSRLRRELDGDETEGDIRIWVTDKAVAKAYVQGDPLKTPVGLTVLPTAAPEKVDAPPPALVEYRGRTYEVSEDRTIEEKFGGSRKPGFQRYVGTEWAP